MIKLNQKSYKTCIEYLVGVINIEKLNTRPQAITFKVDNVCVMLVKLDKIPNVNLKILELRYICKNIAKAKEFQVMDIGYEGMVAGVRSVDYTWNSTINQIILSDRLLYDAKTIEYLESLYFEQ